MRAPIAKVRIASGNPGWYDPLTNIHLTIARPEAYVYEGQNTSNIKKGVAHRLVFIIEGSLNTEKEIKEQNNIEAIAVNEVREVILQEEVTSEKEELTAVEDIPTNKEVTEVKEEKTEEVVDKKTTTKKKTAAKKTVTKKTTKKEKE